LKRENKERALASSRNDGDEGTFMAEATVAGEVASPSFLFHLKVAGIFFLRS